MDVDTDEKMEVDMDEDEEKNQFDCDDLDDTFHSQAETERRIDLRRLSLPSHQIETEEQRLGHSKTCTTLTRREPYVAKRKHEMKALTAAETKELHANCMNKRFVMRRYVQVPDKIILNTYNLDEPGDNDWVTMVHCDLVKDSNSGAVQLLFLLAGRFQLQSCHIVEGDHVLQVIGRFMPGFTSSARPCDNVCCLRVAATLTQIFVFFFQALIHVTGTNPPKFWNKSLYVEILMHVSSNVKMSTQYTTVGFDANNMAMGRAHMTFVGEPLPTFRKTSILKTKVCPMADLMTFLELGFFSSIWSRSFPMHSSSSVMTCWLICTAHTTKGCP
jgi:hypothetical protein